MQNRNFSIWEAGIRANEYVRAHIKESDTHIDTNNLSDEEYRRINTALLKMQSLYVVSDFGLMPKHLGMFEALIKQVKANGIGNCIEMAYLGLDYFMQNYPEVSCEVYEIHGGDHAFLVVGRAFGSDPYSPLTWGQDCYLVDPWSNRVVYAEKFYDLFFMNYKPEYVSNRTINTLEDFDPNRHVLVPFSSAGVYVNSYNILSIRRNDILQARYSELINAYLDKIEHLKEELMVLLQLVIKSEDSKLLYTCSKKIFALKYGLLAINQAKQLAFDERDFSTNYQRCITTVRSLQKQLNDTFNAVDFTKDDRMPTATPATLLDEVKHTLFGKNKQQAKLIEKIQQQIDKICNPNNYKV